MRLCPQCMAGTEIARVTFTSPDRVREVVPNFNADRFDPLHRKVSTKGNCRRPSSMRSSMPGHATEVVAGEIT